MNEPIAVTVDVEALEEAKTVDEVIASTSISLSSTDARGVPRRRRTRLRRRERDNSGRHLVDLILEYEDRLRGLDD